MRKISCLVILLLVTVLVFAQQPPTMQETPSRGIFSQPLVLETPATPFNTNAETDCSNGVDDNNNGLTDLDDFHCYFDPSHFKNGCPSSKIIWACSNMGLHWLNTATGEERYMQMPDAGYYDDLTWTSDGKLYGYDGARGLFQIDPYTLTRTHMGEIEGHYYANGLTGDANGNVYLTAFVSQYDCNIVHFNVVTRQSKIVVNLAKFGLMSAGDLCFLNGFLYVMCAGNTLAKVDIHSGSVEKIVISNPPDPAGSFGMTTLGDGYLYISDYSNKIYRLHPESGTATLFAEFGETYMRSRGFASYPDLCNSPCRSTVDIRINSAPPFCSGEGVMLEAMGDGFGDKGKYYWTLPDLSKAEGKTLKVSATGNYMVAYHQLSPDTCGISTAMTLDVITSPAIVLGNDTAICTGTSYTIQPQYTGTINAVRWHNGSDADHYAVTGAGKYYATVTNTCGDASDTITVVTKTKPSALLPPDTVLCKYDIIEISNLLPKNPEHRYTWSSGSTADILQITEPGTYWLEADNACADDLVRQSITVSPKIDGCECFLHIPDAFTPNGDGINEFFAMRSNCKVQGTLKIYNRWGGLIYSTADLLSGWDGRHGAQVQPSGQYIYVVSYSYFRRPGNFSRKGIIHLLR